MTTPLPTQEPEAISEETFYGDAPTATVYVKWDVDNGRDRPMNIPISTSFTLEGSPKIQGIEINSSQNVTLHAWADTWPNSNPSLTVEGPTSGKRKVDPKRRLGSFRVEPR